MKFNSPLYILFVATSTLANAIPQKRGMSINDIQGHCNSEIIEQNKECLVDFEKISNLEQTCASYKSEKCQKFFTDVVPTLSSCGVADGQLSVDSLKKYMDALCTTDENNNFCPVMVSINSENNANVEEDVYERYQKNINDTCKSKICTDATYALLEQILGTDGLADYKNTVFNKPFSIYDANPNGDSDYYAMAFLKSDYCTQQQLTTKNTSSTSQPPKTEDAAANKQNVQSSNAITTNYSIMLTLVATLLFSLF